MITITSKFSEIELCKKSEKYFNFSKSFSYCQHWSEIKQRKRRLPNREVTVLFPVYCSFTHRHLLQSHADQLCCFVLELRFSLSAAPLARQRIAGAVNSFHWLFTLFNSLCPNKFPQSKFNPTHNPHLWHVDNRWMVDLLSSTSRVKTRTALTKPLLITTTIQRTKCCFQRVSFCLQIYE